MDYRIITTAPNSTRETIQLHSAGPWTAETAKQWAHVEGAKFPEGTRIAIDRRRGMAMYVAYRRYTVDNGIVRRTDRTSQKA